MYADFVTQAVQELAITPPTVLGLTCAFLLTKSLIQATDNPTLVMQSPSSSKLKLFLQCCTAKCL